MKFALTSCLTLLLCLSSFAKNPLTPVKTDHPRDTMSSYMEAMQDYKEGIDTGDPTLLKRLNDAVRCFNLEEVPILNREQVGKDAAIFLKEVIDRVILIDYSKIPENTDSPRWRLKDTEITISRVESGPRVGEYLFTTDTAMRASEFYDKVEELPYLKGSGEGAGLVLPWMDRLPHWMTYDYFTLQVWQWTGILLAIFLGLTLRTCVTWLGNSIQKLTHRTRTDWDTRLVIALSGPIAMLAASGLWFFALNTLQIKGMALAMLNILVQVLLYGSLIWLAYNAVDLATLYYKHRLEKTKGGLDAQLLRLATRTLKIFVVILGVLMAAQNMGINVFSLLAGLGIGGLAFALAAKDTVANFFGSLMIMFDKPFKVGHWVLVNGQEGTVEDIGFRSTRIRTFYNSLISIPNSVVATADIDNMGMREYRRVKTFVGVTYDTPPEKIEAFLEGIKNIIKANPYTRKDYFHVVFNQFGPSSLDILLYFFLKVPDWATELVERQNVFLEIIHLAKKLEIDFAFPTQSLHIETFPGEKPVRDPHKVDFDELAASAIAYGKGGEKARPGGSGLFTPPHRESQIKVRGGDDGE